MTPKVVRITSKPQIIYKTSRTGKIEKITLSINGAEKGVLECCISLTIHESRRLTVKGLKRDVTEVNRNRTIILLLLNPDSVAAIGSNRNVFQSIFRGFEKRLRDRWEFGGVRAGLYWNETENLGRYKRTNCGRSVKFTMTMISTLMTAGKCEQSTLTPVLLKFLILPSEKNLFEYAGSCFSFNSKYLSQFSNLCWH